MLTTYFVARDLLFNFPHEATVIGKLTAPEQVRTLRAVELEHTALCKHNVYIIKAYKPFYAPMLIPSINSIGDSTLLLTTSRSTILLGPRASHCDHHWVGYS